MIPARQFDLGGGALPLDFANTVGGSRINAPREYLSSYAELVEWARQAGIVTPADADRLRVRAARRPSDAASALARAIELREAIYRVFNAVSAERRPDAEDLRLVGRVTADAVARSMIVVRAGVYDWSWSGENNDLDRIRYAVARAASELLMKGDLRVVGECASETCTWLFIDTSRNRSRRWCSMSDCGNRAKARRHYERAKGARKA